jgi:hypothetical protein
MREESSNGGANQRLANGEWRFVLTSAMGENDGKRKLQHVSSFLKANERDRGVSWSCPSVTAGHRLAGVAGPRRALGPLRRGH